MQTSAELRGLAAIRAAEGVRIGRVNDVVFDAASGRITGFHLDDTGTSGGSFVPISLVQNLGADAIMVTDNGGPMPDSALDPSGSGNVNVRALSGRPVLNPAGTVVGRVTDVQIDEQALAVTAILISTGMLDDVLHRQKAIPYTSVRAIGADSVVVAEE